MRKLSDIICWLALIMFALALTARAQTPPHSATLNWTASADAATNPTLAYNVYRAPGNCPTTGEPTAPTLLGTTSAGATTYTDSSVSAGNTYCYDVRSVLNGVESVGNPVVFATVRVSPPTGLTAVLKP